VVNTAGRYVANVSHVLEGGVIARKFVARKLSRLFYIFSSVDEQVVSRLVGPAPAGGFACPDNIFPGELRRPVSWPSGVTSRGMHPSRTKGGRRSLRNQPVRLSGLASFGTRSDSFTAQLLHSRSKQDETSRSSGIPVVALLKVIVRRARPARRASVRCPP